MKSSIFTVMKKELARFFGDKRMAVTTILMPGLMIYIMYSFMGNAMQNMFTVDEDYKPSVYSVNLPNSVASMGNAAGISFIDTDDVKAAWSSVENEEADLLAVFPENFDEAVAAYSVESGGRAPNVNLYYNSVSPSSQSAYMMMTEMLDKYEASMINKFDINAGEGSLLYDTASENDATGSIFSYMMPMLLLIFLFSGCMAVAPESIAGEKERGTIATMLITPVKRSGIAVGKISALALIALLSGASSTIGTVFSLPKLMGAAADEISGNVYGALDYVLLGVVILSTVLLLVTLISIISAFAKTVKEAQTYVTPMMIVVIAVGVTAMFGGGAAEGLAYYLIPIYNSVQCMVGIFSFEIMPVNIVLTVAMNLFYSALGVFVLTKMFSSEKIIFSK